jgi:hypothetical protein
VASDSGKVIVGYSFFYLSMALEARDAARAATEKNPGVWPNETITCVLMSALSTEAFINELGPLMMSAVSHFDEEFLPEKPVVMNLGALLDEAEKGRATTAFKYQTAAVALTGRAFDTSCNPFQDFADLCSLRNLLVHLRPGDTIDAAGNIVPAEKVIRGFQQRGLTHRRPPVKGKKRDEPGISWLNDLQTDRMAVWAYRTAVNIIAAVVDMLPGSMELTAAGWLKASLEAPLSKA